MEDIASTVMRSSLDPGHENQRASAKLESLHQKRCRKLWCSVVQAELPCEFKVREDYFDEIYEEYRSVGA